MTRYHELSHYALHKNINTLFLRTCTYLKIDKHEMEAETFADMMMNELFKNL
ncbi:ImmA/IrrE family metallo-endopeptidase [Zhenhengia yiwuensis]|uniref:ImmA/IrrE family metallo-endopeptidase n=1 Tax=Zhenhengia yiwuensis TaxID=2763666 RepID=UPI0038CD33CF